MRYHLKIIIGIAVILLFNILPLHAETSQTSNEIFWLWRFLGRLHTLVVHFPVGLLVIALFLELFTLKKRNEDLRLAITILIVTGTVGAVLAAILGWMLADHEQFTGNTLTIHRWTGIGTAALSFITTILLYSIKKKNGTTALNAYRAFLLFTVVGVSIAGHYGANLTHGDDYITSVLPLSEQLEAASPTNFNLASFSDTAKLSEQQLNDLNLEVRAIFAHNCYSCHSSEKIKGELRLDKKEFVMKGGKNGPIIVAGQPEKSELMRRLTLPRDHKESMPPKGKKMSDKDIATVRLWILKGAHWSDSAQKSIFREAKLEPRKPILPPATGDLKNPIDLIINDYFAKQNFPWPNVVNDHIYIRRVHLDIIGLLPTPERINEFIADTRPDKRELLVKEILAKDHDYAQHWMTFWNDALRNDYTGTGYIDGGRSQISEWLYFALFNNKPYNQFVKELVSPKDESAGFIRGIKWRGSVNASQRTEMQAAQNLSQVFLGVNLKCASCHDSFVSNIKLSEAYGFANIFADTCLDINRCDKPIGKKAGMQILFKELGTIDSTASTRDRLKQLADYIIQPKNGRLYRTIVNRMWASLMGRGIVEPVDLMDNEPWNQDLLDWMASDFVDNGYDIKKLIYLITTSKTYQLPSVPVKDAQLLASQDYKFRGMVVKRMTAEQFTDAVSSTIEPVFKESNFDPFSKIEEIKTKNKSLKTYPWVTQYETQRDYIQYSKLSEDKKKSYPHLLLAGKADDYLGLKIKPNGVAGFITDNSFLKFKNIDLTNIDKVSYGYGTPANTAFSVIHLDSLNGKIISIASLGYTGGYDNFKSGFANVKEVSGKHDIYIVFKAHTDLYQLFDMYWINFLEKGTNPGVALKINTETKDASIIKAQTTFKIPAKPKEKFPFVRASRVNNNQLLASLGRPNRETAITTRMSQANLLQALEVTNGNTLNEVLGRAADNWKEKYKTSDELSTAIFQKTLGRKPTDKEIKIAESVVGKTPSKEGIQDLFWAVVLLPEFQLIY